MHWQKRVLCCIHILILSTCFFNKVAEIRLAVVNEVNELGETALFTAAEKGHLDVVKELLQYTTKEGILLKNQSGFDPLHIAANQGHQGIRISLLSYGYNEG